MKREQFMDDFEYTGGRNNGIFLNSIINMNEDTCPMNFHMTNGISPVENSNSFYNDDMDHSQLLNLDDQSKRKVLGLDSNFNDEPSFTKSLFYNEDEIIDLHGWKKKPAMEWSKNDTKCWLISAAMILEHSYPEMPSSLVMPGKELIRLSRQDFIYQDRMFGGKMFDLLHGGYISENFLPPFNTFQSISDDELSREGSNNYSDGESMKGSDFVPKRPIGRPRHTNSKVKTVKPRLVEFLINLLHNPAYCPSLICWENYEKKIFRFVKSDSVAKLWGARKGNKNMNYEKFSRAMRYYYKKETLEPVRGRRLVYKFGKLATGLETEDPNFEKARAAKAARGKF